MNFRISFFKLLENAVEIFTGIILNLYVNLGEMTSH